MRCVKDAAPYDITRAFLLFCRGRRSHLSARSVLLLRRGVHRTPAPPTTRYNQKENVYAETNRLYFLG